MSKKFDECILEISEQVGGIDSETRKELNLRLNGVVKRFIDSRDGVSLSEALQKEVDKITQEELLAGKVAARNAYLNFITREETLSFIKRSFAKNPLAGIESLMVGTQSLTEGSRSSIALAQEAMQRRYLGGMFYDIQKSDHEKLLLSGKVSREIARYMFLRNDKEALAKENFQSAVKELGEIFHKWNDVARREANDAGANIRELSEYITRQSHSMEKVRKAGPDEWIEFIKPRLDVNRMTASLPINEGESVEDALNRYLRSVYEAISSGDYDRAEVGYSPPSDRSGLGRRKNHERKLHFKDGGDWFDYNEKFGNVTLPESMMWNLIGSARTTAIMKTLGPSANQNLQDIKNALKSSIDDPKRREKFLKAFEEDGRIAKYLRNITGQASSPVNQTAANFFSGVRALESMSKLGGSMITSFSDLAMFSQEYSRTTGSFLEGFGTAFSSIVRNVGPAKEDQLKFANLTGAFSDAMIGSIAARMGGDVEIPGKIANSVNLFFKWNGQQWLTDSLKLGMTAALSRELAMSFTKQFSDLNPDLKQIMKSYRITPEDWDIARASELFDYRGNKVMTVEAIGRVDNEVFERILKPEIDAIKKRKPNNQDAQIAAVIRKKRAEVQDKFQGYLTDRVEHAVVTPDAKTKTILNQGTRPGTPMGEIARLAMQFKAYPIAILQKGIGRALFKDVTYDDMNSMASVVQGLKKNWFPIARLALVMTALGYTSMTAKEFLKGRKPRDPFDGRTFLDAFLQGGAGGILGDFLLNPVPDRVGGGLPGVMLGPAFSDASKLYSTYQAIMAGEGTAGPLFRQAVGMTPGQNLFYLRPILDHMFIHEMNETLTPGYLRRAERRLENDSDVEFWLRPSEAAR